MGKDFRPIDMYFADRELGLRNLHIANMPIDLQDPEAKSLYPELSFLFSDFATIFTTYKNDPASHTVFKQFETALIIAEKQALSKPRWDVNKTLWRLSNDKFYSTPVNDVVAEWFYGRLSEDFHYSDENNYQLNCYMANYIESKLLKAHRKKKGQ